jgi:hypothetical protein
MARSAFRHRKMPAHNAYDIGARAARVVMY